MKKKSLAYGALALLLASCSTSKKIQALKPEASYSKEVVYDKQLSYVQLPVEISIADIQNQTNKFLNGLIFEDNKLEDDNLQLKVWKQGPIVVTENGGKLHIELPMKVWTQVRYGVEKFGLSAYDTRDVNLNGVIKINASVALTNWKLSTQTQVAGIEWKESPTISIMGKKMPITYLINPAIAAFKGRMGQMVDQSIEKAIDVKPYVIDAIQSIAQPMQVNQEYNTWFGIQPLELYATKAVVANKKITMNLGMKAYLETVVGNKPGLSFDKNKLALTAVEKMPSEFNANIASIVTYQNAAALMQKNFNGQKFESGKRSVTVSSIDLWGKDGKMIVEVGMKGTVNGMFYLSGVPKYDAAKREVYMDDVDFVLDSKNKLLKTGDWLVHGLIAKKIQESCRFSISDQLKEGEKTMAGFLTNYEPMKGVKVNGAMTQLSPNRIFLTPNALVAMVVAKGKVGISINGM
ncbi:DUF4403 family protein [Desertivirga arenae]|uniref:DUF4403 family protein n=1 Tax=Desertivirga arenae TaxID=2810309 RepID=UPI001A96F6AA|nr:DUF4403 family protein [Pedobacter sp. SYSU D00823]